MRRDATAAVLIALLGLLAIALNWQQPLVRNSLVYARAAEHVIAHGYDPRAVVADSRLSYDKPVAFPWFASPLVAAFGNHHGLMLASALGWLAMVAATLQLLAAVLPAAEHERLRTRALLFSTLSPLAIYQGWSAHPDAMETALMLSALAQAWTLTAQPTSSPWRRAAVLLLTVEAGALCKNYGLVLLAALPLAFAPRLLASWRRGERAMLVALATAWLLLAGLSLLAFLGLHPLHRVTGEGGGAGQYGQGEWLASAGGALLALFLTLLTGLHVALSCLLWARPRAFGLWPLFAFAAVYTAGLLPFPNCYYNMRYFLPVVPIVGLAAATGIERMAAGAGRTVVIAFTAVALLFTAVFNVAPLHAIVAPHLPAWRLRGEQMPSMLDNLRMQLHRDQRAWLDGFNAALPGGAVVYMVGFGYYVDAQHGVYERAGLIRGDVTTIYGSRRSLQPKEAEFFVCFGGRPDVAWLQGLGRVETLRPDLFEVTR